MNNALSYSLFSVSPKSQVCFIFAPKTILHSQYAFIGTNCISSAQQPLGAGNLPIRQHKAKSNRQLMTFYILNLFSFLMRKLLFSSKSCVEHMKIGKEEIQF